MGLTMTNQTHIVESVLNELRPMIQRDGGNIELVNIENNIVYVKLLGACVSCPASLFTLKFGIEESIKAKLPEIQEVVPL